MSKDKHCEIISQLLSGNTVITVTVGDSMEPLLYDRDTQVVIAPLNGELQAGDLPLYQRPSGQLVMHRIIRKDSDCYYTRGDNRCDLEPIPKDWAYGVVTEIYRKGKRICASDKKYMFYVRIWGMIYPARGLIYKIKSRWRQHETKQKEYGEK